MVQPHSRLAVAASAQQDSEVRPDAESLLLCMFTAPEEKLALTCMVCNMLAMLVCAEGGSPEQHRQRG